MRRIDGNLEIGYCDKMDEPLSFFCVPEILLALRDSSQLFVTVVAMRVFNHLILPIDDRAVLSNHNLTAQNFPTNAVVLNIVPSFFTCIDREAPLE